MGSTSGVITSLQICPGHGVPMRRVEPATFLADLGLEGCKHAVAGSRRQVLLMDEETLDDLNLEPAILKENVTTRDIDLAALPAETRLRLGSDVELWITGPCDPCHLMDQIRAGLKEELRGRRGVLAWVKKGGTVKVGDRIEAHPPGTGEE
jgi:MOSC domain-containing protein YiiM